MDERWTRNVDETLANLQVRMGAAESSVGVINMRLDNGSESFGEMGRRIKELEPRRTSPLLIVGLSFTLITSGATALWVLANTLRDRPTIEQITEIVERHDTDGHADLRRTMVEYGADQKITNAAMKALDRKLDELLERTPERIPVRRK